MIKKLLYIVAGLLFLIVVYRLVDFFQFRKHRNELVYEKGYQTMANLKNQVNDILTKIETEGEKLASLLGGSEISKEAIERLIKQSSLDISEIQGVTACFQPYALSADQRLYCPYYNKGTQDFLFVEKSYDYSKSIAGSEWYTSVRDNGAKWVEPYYAKAANDWYVDYGVPFYFDSGPKKGKVKGTITMSFLCSGFKQMIHELSVGKTGYGLITSTEGTLLAHPINEFIGTKKLTDIELNKQESALAQAYNELNDGKKGLVEFFDPSHNDNKIFIYDNIASSDWGIGLMFFKKDLQISQKALNRKYIILGLFISLFFVCLLAIYYNKDYLDKGEIWRLSIVSSILLFSNLCLIGYLQHTTNLHNPDESAPITDITSLKSFLQQRDTRSTQLKIPKLQAIPTGIYIQRMEFQDSYNLNVGGTVWQKYPKDLAESVTIGFQFPQMSPFAEASSIEESYRTIIEGKEGETGYLLVGWDFRVTLRMNLSYKDFPFDKQHLSIEILPLDKSDHLIFTPDLASYSFTNPSKKSGIAEDVEISGSEIIESYFNYTLLTYDSDFGYGNKGMFEETPVLHYNISLSRILLNSFVTYLIPILVTLIMVFILIFACVKTNERQGIIESMAAFFFVLIFSHIDLRKEIETADLIYIEYFYFISYAILIFSTFNLISYTKDKSAIFDFNDNQIFKAIYFPLFLVMLMGITLYKFY